MIYGKRFFDKSKAIEFKTEAELRADHDQQAHDRRSHLALRWLYRSFQLKYVLFLTAAGIGCVVAFVGPIWFFLSQNYGIFQKLAYDVNPQLLEHLDRELIWLKALMIVAILGLGCFCAWIALKVTDSIISPLIGLERHMKKITLGDWSAEDFRTRATDDFRSLTSTYSYLYRAMRAQTLSDIRMLEKLMIDPKDHEAMQTWSTLINSKRQQLGFKEVPLSTDANVASTSSSRSKRLAS